jgi:hypothetical protein
MSNLLHISSWLSFERSLRGSLPIATFLLSYAKPLLSFLSPQESNTDLSEPSFDTHTYELIEPWGKPMCGASLHGLRDAVALADGEPHVQIVLM